MVRRRSSTPLTDAFERGAVAAMAGHDRADGRGDRAERASATKPGFQKPVVILAPKDAASPS
jgi:hypothetical protein